MSGGRHKSDQFNRYLNAPSVAEETEGKQPMFIVQCRPPTPDAAAKINAATRKAAMEAANDFLNLEMPFVTISADGRVYSVEEFATSTAGVPRYEAELENLEEMAGKLVVAAFNLPPGVARYESLMLIDSFRERIAAMKRSRSVGMRVGI
jgi:hypothetical protein